jgi:hypothetical protein
MPARSVLLNVSITAKAIGKDSVMKEVREVDVVANTNVQKPAVGEEVKRERVDSATADTAPAMDTSLHISTPYTVTAECFVPAPNGKNPTLTCMFFYLQVNQFDHAQLVNSLPSRMVLLCRTAKHAHPSSTVPRNASD